MKRFKSSRELSRELSPVALGRATAAFKKARILNIPLSLRAALLIELDNQWLESFGINPETPELCLSEPKAVSSV